MPVSWRKIAVTLIDPPDQPMRPQPDTDACEAYIFSVDAYTQRRIHELRDEIAALQHQNALYTQHPFHTRAERHTRDLRQGVYRQSKKSCEASMHPQRESNETDRSHQGSPNEEQCLSLTVAKSPFHSLTQGQNV